MSRVGKSPIEVPKGVEVKIDGHIVNVKGPKGNLSKTLPECVSIALDGSSLTVKRKDEQNHTKALHGLYRMLVANMIKGVAQGFEKRLELSGVGYRAAKQGSKLSLQVGFSHPVVFDPPAGIEFKVEGTDKIVVFGIDKELVGRLASEIKLTKPIEPYKLKGIKYAGEKIKKKAGKAAKTAGAGK
jgi:large subunit ribosomal protein L6